VAKRSKSSSRWLERQRRDPFVRRAAEEKLGSRAHFKLSELDRRFRLVRRDSLVLELGAAPGGWTRYLAGRARRVVALDRLPMEVPKGVEFALVDVHADDFDAVLDALLAGDGVDLVLSDMAPNISGVRVADQAASMELVELATHIARQRLNRGGHLVVKMFQGEGVDAWLKDARTVFEKVVLAKPEASRKDSREVYGVAMHFTDPD
jgi:23S rRNA (uridine2552-2'-O)-methyltransferase